MIDDLHTPTSVMTGINPVAVYGEDLPGFKRAFRINGWFSWRGWLVITTASLFFFYEFLQLSLFNVLNSLLMQAFHVNATQLGHLSSLFYYANIVLLLPAGALLDRYSIRRLILIALLVCIGGVVLFALSHSLWPLELGRLMMGMGSAFCFGSSVRLASRWISSKHMALAISVIVTLGMLGGVVAQTPLTLLIDQLDWRTALWWDVVLGCLLWCLIAVFVQDYPQQSGKNPVSLCEVTGLGLWLTMKRAVASRQNWLCGLYTCLMNLPIFLFGAVWGMLYFEQVHGLTRLQASVVTSMVFMGTIVGSPVVGWLSDRLERRRLPMLIGAVTSLGLVLMIILWQGDSFLVLSTLVFLLGMMTSTQVLSYPVVTESNPRALTATSVSIVSICALSGGAVFQPLFGWLMDWHWDSVMNGSLRIYSPDAYHLALMTMPCAFFVAICLLGGIRETYAKPK